jgi:hypothetical protein
LGVITTLTIGEYIRDIKMKYKIGDKVRIISFPVPEYIGKTFELISVNPQPSVFAGRIILPTGNTTLVYNREVEKAHRKGEQLMLFDL